VALPSAKSRVAPAEETPHNHDRHPASKTKAPFLVAEMDPLSITTAVLTIITAAEQTRRALDRVRTVLKAMPGRLSALNNQVVDLEVLLHQIVSLMESHDQHPELARPEAHSQIQDVVHRAGALLQELRDLSARIEKAGDGRSRLGSVQRARAWQRYLPRLHEIQDSLTGVKSTLNLLLGASNSSAATFPSSPSNVTVLILVLTLVVCQLRHDADPPRPRWRHWPFERPSNATPGDARSAFRTH